MERSFSPRDVIQVPRMDAHTASVFGRRLLAQFAPHRKTLRGTKVAARAAALERATDALEQTLAAQHARERAPRTGAELDPVVDATWGALVGFLEAWARLAWRDEATVARAILAAVFPDRLEFTQRTHAQQWSEANVRIAQMDAPRADAPDGATIAQQIEALGGAALLAEIREKHARFAKALGITAATTPPAEVSVREPYEAVLGAAKDYIAAATQLDDGDVADAEVVRRELLHVIDEFERSTSGVAAKPAPAPSPAPTPSG